MSRCGAVFLAFLAGIGCSTSAGPVPLDNPIDPNLTPETRSLHTALQRMTAASTFAFGQHIPDWASDSTGGGGVGISDWEATTGTRPPFHEWDWIVILGGPEGNYITRPGVVNLIKQEYQEGAFIGFSWHLENPALEGQPGNDYRSHDSVPVVPRLLPGGDLHQHYIDNYLSAFADALDDLHINGVRIPIIMRPYHEPGWLELDQNGNAVDGFWWNWCTVEEYKALWRMTVEYFRDTRQLNNLLWAYSPNRPSTQEFYDARYQEEYIDICGVDMYLRATDPNPDFATALSFAITRGQADGKIVAFTELGGRDLSSSGSAGDDWYSNKMYNQLAPHAADFAFAQTWANWGNGNWWVPPPSASPAKRQDFIDFLAMPEVNYLSEMLVEFGDLYSQPSLCSDADVVDPIGTRDYFDLAMYLDVSSNGCGLAVQSPLTQTDLLGLDTAWNGVVNSVAIDGPDAVIVNATASPSGFLTIRGTERADISAQAAFGFRVTDLDGAYANGVTFVQTGPEFLWHEGPLTSVSGSYSSPLAIEPALVADNTDVRGWGIQLYGASAGQTSRLLIELYAVTPSCGWTDIVAPFGEVDAADLATFLAELVLQCP